MDSCREQASPDRTLSWCSASTAVSNGHSLDGSSYTAIFTINQAVRLEIAPFNGVHALDSAEPHR